MVKIDILSDPVCPWCFIGKAQLDRALAERPGHPFVLEWHPFQLNPDMPREGADRRDYLEAKFGGAEAAARIYARVEAAAAQAGLTLDFGAIRRTPNTLDAHRLIHWAGIEGRQTAVVDALFRAYFQQGRDIGDPDTLTAIAADQGMDAATVRRLLDGEADRDDIAARDAHSRSHGVTGVPTFVVAGRHVLPGAQPADLWVRVIDDLAAQAGDAPG